MIRAAALIGLAACIASASMPAWGQGAHCFAHDLPSKFYTDGFNADDMHFSVRQLEGKRVLIAEGGFDASSAERFKQFLSTAGVIDELWFNSPGGNVLNGLSIGRQIRAAGLFVRVPVEFACVSSCTLALLGGALRQVDDGAYYGVHMFSNYRDYRDDSGVKQLTDLLDALALTGLERIKKLNLAKTPQQKELINTQYAGIIMKYVRGIEEDSAKMSRELARYILDMSASMKFLNDMFDQPQEHECYLDALGLDEYNVTNVK